MTIQLSVVIWTIINFILLMLILHFLLYKPVLKVMDERKKRIASAKEKKEAIDKLESEYESMLVEEEKAFLEAQQKEIEEEIETIRLETKKAVEEAREERLQLVDDYREQTKIQQEEILEFLHSKSGELAALFADSIIKE